MQRSHSVLAEHKQSLSGTRKRRRNESVDSYFDETLRNGPTKRPRIALPTSPRNTLKRSLEPNNPSELDALPLENAPGKQHSARETEAAAALLQLSREPTTGDEKLDSSKAEEMGMVVHTVMGPKTRIERDSAAGKSSDAAGPSFNPSSDETGGQASSRSATPRKKGQSACGAFLEEQAAEKLANEMGRGERKRPAPKSGNANGPAPPTKKAKTNPKSKPTTQKKAAPKDHRADDLAQPKKRPRLIWHGPKKPEGSTPDEPAGPAEAQDNPPGDDAPRVESAPERTKKPRLVLKGPKRPEGCTPAEPVGQAEARDDPPRDDAPEGRKKTRQSRSKKPRQPKKRSYQKEEKHSVKKEVMTPEPEQRARSGRVVKSRSSNMI